MKIDASLMFDPLRNGEMAAELEELGFDGVYSFEGQHDAFMSLVFYVLFLFPRWR